MILRDHHVRDKRRNRNPRRNGDRGHQAMDAHRPVGPGHGRANRRAAGWLTNYTWQLDDKSQVTLSAPAAYMVGQTHYTFAGWYRGLEGPDPAQPR